tara:strand:+ start:19949 stop:20089 length:141 start_codon:yes stop_codon:yes gene_type:complete
MRYIGYCTTANAYVFARDNSVETIEVVADSLPMAIERARQHFFGMA